MQKVTQYISKDTEEEAFNEILWRNKISHVCFYFLHFAQLLLTLQRFTHLDNSSGNLLYQITIFL